MYDSYFKIKSSKFNLDDILRFFILNFLFKSKVNSEFEIKLEFEISIFWKLFLKINKIKSLFILFFLLLKFPFTENLLFSCLIFKNSELKFILLNLNKILSNL